jgi:hypothetical protein
LAKYPAAGHSYIEVDDWGGTPRDLSPYIDEIGPLGPEVVVLDVTGLNDTAPRLINGVGPGQELVLRGLFDDTPTTGLDAVLSGIVGRTGTVSYGLAGHSPGQRKITGEFLCLSYRVISKVGGPVRFEARFQQDGVIALTTWP